MVKNWDNEGDSHVAYCSQHKENLSYKGSRECGVMCLCRAEFEPLKTGNVVSTLEK